MVLGEVQRVEEATIICMVSWEQHGQNSNPGPDFHVTSDWLRLLPWGVSAHVATLAVMVPPWPGSALLLSPSSLAGLAHSGVLLLASRLVFLSLGLFTRNMCFLEPLFASQTVEARRLVCVSSSTERAAWGRLCHCAHWGLGWCA